MRNFLTFIITVDLLCFLIAIIIGCQTPIHYPEGGYDYPQKIIDSNHYFYPLKDSFSKKDTPAKAENFLYSFFDEPNLSLRPKNEECFRLFVYGFKQTPTIVVLTKEKIVIKISNNERFFVEDTNRLTPVERFHFKLLTPSYTPDEYLKLLSSRKSVDSLTRLYPKLFEKSYRKYLINKAIEIPNKLFAYTTRQKEISYGEFYRLVSLLNGSGYWKLSRNVICKDEHTDGFGYILEANTTEKYNVVFADACNDEEAFKKACQELIKCAGLDMKSIGVWYGIQLYWDDEARKYWDEHKDDPRQPLKIH